MTIYGVSLLAFCYFVGQLLGDYLGKLLHVQANVGGVGFAMILLIFINTWMEKRKLNTINSDAGISFWSQMYIPIIVAMAATQNVKVAISGGTVALLAGFIPVVISYLAIPYLAKYFKNPSI
jgi:malonate transporter MadL subunit